MVGTRTLSSRTGVIRPSPTLALTAKLQELRRQGVDVVSFAAGEPDFVTPEPICQAAIDALKGGFTFYTPSSGIPDLRQAVADKLVLENGLTATPDRVMISCGAKHAVYNALMVLIEPGDEVILVAPYWMTYRDQVALAGGQPVIVTARADDDFVPDPMAIAAAITPRTKAILINSPNNPTGAVWPAATLQAIAELAERHDLWIVADEIYERLTYGEPHKSIGSFSPEIEARTVTIGGCSKTYAMTGWRIGWTYAPLNVVKAMGVLQDQVTSNATSFAQRGAVEAVRMDQSAVEAMRQEFERRRDLMVSRLRQIPGLIVREPKGAFYVFAGVEAFLGNRLTSDVELAGTLLEQARVGVIPGSVFEGPGFLRLSFATHEDAIRKGTERIADALAQLA